MNNCINVILQKNLHNISADETCSYAWNNEIEEDFVIEPTAFGDPLIRTLYLMDQGLVLAKEDKRLKVIKQGQTINTVPITKIDQIFIFGNIQITTQAMRLCLENNLPIVLFSSIGKYYGSLESFSQVKVHLHKKQFEITQNRDFRLSIAKSIVKGKIKNSKVVLQKYNRRNDSMLDDIIIFINAMIQKVDRAKDINELMGIEGLASARYFAAFRMLIPDEWKFERRSKYPPADPVNSMLSYGYTLLFHNIYGMVRSQGLHPFFGFLHEPKEGHPTMVSDLMEEFRAPVVDATVLNLISRRILSTEDFYYSEGDNISCFLSDSARRFFIRALENKMNSSITHSVTGSKADYRRCMALQVRSMKRLIEGIEKYYEPMAIK